MPFEHEWIRGAAIAGDCLTHTGQLSGFQGDGFVSVLCNGKQRPLRNVDWRRQRGPPAWVQPTILMCSLVVTSARWRPFRESFDGLKVPLVVGVTRQFSMGCGASGENWRT